MKEGIGSVDEDRIENAAVLYYSTGIRFVLRILKETPRVCI